MRLLIKIWPILFLFLCFCIPNQAQGYYYPLDHNADENNGYGSMILTNTPFQPEGGIYLNGVFGSSLARTPSLDNLEIDDPYGNSAFSISAHFKLASFPQPGSRRPIFICGDVSRWLGVEVTHDGFVGLLYNDNNFIASDAVLELDT